jgi:Ca2+-transporting ATPase
MATTTAPLPTATETPTWHVLSREGAVHELEVEPERGLSSAEAASRLERYGPNKFAEAKTEPRWHAFLRQYRDPMQLVLLAACSTPCSASASRARPRRPWRRWRR